VLALTSFKPAVRLAGCWKKVVTPAKAGVQEFKINGFIDTLDSGFHWKLLLRLSSEGSLIH
jgi:hypothetical protein